MLPIAIQIGSIIAGKVIAHGISQLLKDQKYESVKSKYEQISYTKDVEEN